jgi:hypothetical protein
LASCLLGSGCAPFESTKWLTLPDLSGFRAIALSVERDAVPQIEVRDLRPGADPGAPFLVVESTRNERLTLELLVFDRSLASLGLQEGIVPALTATESGVPLASFAKQFYQAVVPDSFALAPESHPSDALASFAIKSIDTSCQRFSATRFDLGVPYDVHFARAVDAHRVLVGATSAELLLDVLTATAAVLPRTTTLTAGLLAGIRASDGAIWLGIAGSIYRAPRFALPLEPSFVFAIPNGEYIEAIAEGETPEQLYLLSNSLAFERWDGHTVEVLARLPPPTVYLGGSLTRTSSGEILIETSELSTIGRWKSGGPLSIEPVTTIRGGGHYVIAETQVGLVAGTGRGEIVRRADGQWTPLGASPLTVDIYAVAPYAGGFLYGGHGGNFGQYTAEGRYCDLSQPLGTPIEAIVVFPELGRVFLGGRSGAAAVLEFTTR